MTWRITIGLITNLLLSFTVMADTGVGFQQITLADGVNNRSLDVAVFYPASSSQQATIIGENVVFPGIAVSKSAVPESGEHPLIVVSHGYGGSWFNQLWLAQALVKQGYIVAAPNHPGTTTKDMRMENAQELWQRPKDISRVITALLATPEKTGQVDAKRIAAVGHSLGGWTVLELAGGRFSTDQFERDCLTHVGLASCNVYEKMRVAKSAPSRAQLDASLADRRIGAVVSLDMGLARGFTTESLAAINIPVLIMAAGYPNEELPAELESHYLVQKMSPAHSAYKEIADATHFSFMQLCKPGAVEIINAENPGDGMICLDGGERSREQIHQEVAKDISGFLQTAWLKP
ncbi:alpha/beta fold hydrolase [Pectobacterium parmentieri]|uniref:alpha/beta hydrolase family protein n=1 Tax=Pectobacterium parmentieri TaxID=1905730 RepID=UPI000CDDC148|nr:alpha/beta fold hydrolase [Pectobacterium parmentieri]AYH02546.1 dienelactone hydrolase [Pectobacterium parmentieri]AYH06811.1 dienelactone hydrolase [Pectobacterium parmentieri]AYH15625.1 dienelactone hydrolase [Pectobacterium parmentieri]AYH24330.1 dienelactone hydrolase [Pectobacterium parmentieri]AYH28811.1 dienelactone hydrolase [Pectobacterium parmentieri]